MGLGSGSEELYLVLEVRDANISVQAIQLERSPTRVEIERELAWNKNAPRGKSLWKETSPSSRVSDALPEHDRDWRRSIERNIECIMQHLQVSMDILTKASSANSDNEKRGSSDHCNGSDSAPKSQNVNDGIVQLQVQV